MYKESFDKFPPEIQDAVTTAPDKRTPIQWQMYYKAKPQLEHRDGGRRQEAARAKRSKHWGELKTELAKFDDIKPPDTPVAQAMIDNGTDAPKTHVLAVGVYDAYKEEVQPGFLSILDPTDAKITPPPDVNSTGRRTALANWLADPRESADHARDGESHLALSFRPGHRGHAQRFRSDGRASGE